MAALEMLISFLLTLKTTPVTVCLRQAALGFSCTTVPFGISATDVLGLAVVDGGGGVMVVKGVCETG